MDWPGFSLLFWRPTSRGWTHRVLCALLEAEIQRLDSQGSLCSSPHEDLETRLSEGFHAKVSMSWEPEAWPIVWMLWTWWARGWTDRESRCSGRGEPEAGLTESLDALDVVSQRLDWPRVSMLWTWWARGWTDRESRCSGRGEPEAGLTESLDALDVVSQRRNWPRVSMLWTWWARGWTDRESRRSGRREPEAGLTESLDALDVEHAAAELDGVDEPQHVEHHADPVQVTPAVERRPRVLRQHLVSAHVLLRY